MIGKKLTINMIQVPQARWRNGLSVLFALGFVVLSLMAFNAGDRALGVGWLCAGVASVQYFVAGNRASNKPLHLAALPFAAAFFLTVVIRIL